MRLPKNNFASKVALRYANAMRWTSPFGFIAVLSGMYLRKKCSSRTEVFLGVPVYFIERKTDLSIAWSWLEGSAALLNTTSPFWEKQVKNLLKSIIVQDLGPMSRYDRKDRC